MFALVLQWMHTRLEGLAEQDGEAGFSTAELLGNAALGVAALVVIWQGISGLGGDLLAQIRSSLGL